jgi:tRNA pseudouridine32 synthase/23S rRNA pseudouridine746 synthase/23S rRNA pseudouridine1911/1915/1917 synthase
MQAKASQETDLLTLLKELAPDSSMSTLRSWIEKGRVCVDGKIVARAKLVVKKGQEVKVGPRVHFIRGGIKILFEDEHLVVIEKPEGLLSVATDSPTNLSAHDILKRHFQGQRVFPVHRLDRETSGVMIFAYSEATRDYFKEQFEQRLVEKIYFAVVEGRIENKQGTWKSYLKEDETYYVRSTPWENEGKLAVTHYEVEAQNRRYALVRFCLETGRKNQIRVHCQDAGLPIVGDKKYGSKCNPIKRMALHSQKISFKHPITKKQMTFEVAFPHSFSKLVNT